MKRIIGWILVCCLLLMCAACKDAGQQPANPVDTDKTPTQGQSAAPQPEVYSVVAYAVGELFYEGDELKTYGIAPTELTLNPDHTGKLNLMGSEMDIGWTDEGDVTIAGQKLYSFTREDADTIVLKIMETVFTLRKNGAAGSAPTVVEATEPPANQSEQPQQNPTDPPQNPGAPTGEPTYAEPYGDSDGVIEHGKLAGLYHWLDSMQSEFRYTLSFDEIGAAVGKAGCDKQDGDGSYHAAYWTDGSEYVTVTFRNRDGVWTCGSISTGMSSDEYNAADISAFPKLGCSAPAGSSPTETKTFEGKCGGTVVNVGAALPTKNWYGYKGSFDIRFYCAPDEENAKYSYSYFKIEFAESEEKVHSDDDSLENVTELAGRSIGGVNMSGRSYKLYGMDWVEYCGQIADGVWARVKLTGVDLSAGTETEAILNSLTFTVQ